MFVRERLEYKPLKATNGYLRRINFLSQKLLLQTPVTFVSIKKNQFIRINSFHAEPWIVSDMYELPHELPNDLRLRILGN